MSIRLPVSAGILSAGLLIASSTTTPSQAAVKPFGFQCFKAGPAYVIGLGSMAALGVGGTAMSPAKVGSLQGSGSFPIALITPALANYPVERRCASIAARLTNLALATNTATPAGIINLTNNMVAGTLDGLPVLAIKSVSKSNVVATLPKGIDPEKALQLFGSRIQRVAARKVISNAIKDGDIIEFRIYSE
jgi:hypothetical protein